MATLRCPCSSGLPYAECCGPVHDRVRPAPTAEALMRSRYAAFALRRSDWLLESWHPSTRPAEIEPGDERWIGLEIEATEAGGPFDRAGTVTFRASYVDDGERFVVHERSRFVRDDAWRYVDGDQLR
jgi:SEC-C motif-containing protein